MADKALPYEVLKRVMRPAPMPTTARISLAVMQKEKPVPRRPGRAGRRGGDQRMLLAPYYREYELAWEAIPRSSARFRRILRGGCSLLLLLG